ncbi:probable cytochrome P450 313a5 [Drosophila madeirensis]|uniref:Probable cytochrome P450 313a5 n=1 Tax=Drosophila madeirensis TaxID=30013 RepID=A0AAU9EY91_DROMD
MYSLQLWIVVVILAWIYFLWSRRRFYLLMLRVKGHIGYPLVGFYLQYLRKKRNTDQRVRYYQKYGPTHLSWLGTVPVLLTCEPNVVQDILTSPHCLDKSHIACNALQLTAGPGIMALRGSHWVERRKQMNPSFRHNVLMSFLPLFNEETNNLISLLHTFVGQGEQKLLPEFINWSFTTALQSTMGSDVKENPDIKNGTLLNKFHYLLEDTSLSVIHPWRQNQIIATLLGIQQRRSKMLNYLNAFVLSIIEEKLKTQTNASQESFASRNTVINRVVELIKSGELSYADAMGECLLTIVAGFETSAVTVFTTLTLLALFPEHQEAAFEELKNVFPNGGDSEVSHDDIQKLVFLDRVMNESMRLLPPVPLLPRETSADLQLTNGVLIPKGVTVAIDILNVHRNKNFWGPEADTFNPDNFLPKNIRERHPYAFIPFNKGKRNCLGWKYAELSTKIALAKILSNFRVSTSFLYEDISFLDNIVMNLREKPLFEVHRR